MFGKHWISADAVVVAKSSVKATSDHSFTIYDYVVDVASASGELFRAKVSTPKLATHFLSPSVGMTVGVEYDEKSRDVRFDKDDRRLSTKDLYSVGRTNLDDVLHQPAGTAPAGAAALPAGFGQMEQLLRDRGINLSEAMQGNAQHGGAFLAGGTDPQTAAAREAMLKALGLPGTEPQSD